MLMHKGTFRQAGVREYKQFYDLAQYAIIKCDWEGKNKTY